VKPHTVPGALRELLSQRQLLRELVARDVQARHRGTFFGLGWLVAYPVLMMSVYTFVFGGVFKSRWMNQGGLGDFVVMLFCGLIVFTLFAEVVNRASGAITGQPNFVKKVVFPLQLLPLVPLGAALFNAAISFVILVLLMLATGFGLPATALFAPLVLLPLLLLTAGTAWGVAALGVFFRDLGQIVGIATSALLFLSPVFFPVASVPAAAQAFVRANPLTYPMEEIRHVLVMGLAPDWLYLGLYTLVAAAVAGAGLWLFQRSRPAFADVL
jgi:lipopolysaccharide transport system permease protein